MSDDEDFGEWDDSIQQEAIQLAAVTPARLQQRTLFGGIAQVQVSPGAASYAVNRNAQRERNEPPTHHLLDPDAIKTWVYPTNYPQRDYQFNMIQKALYGNLLIALPTGLGKTFIAAVVMYNWYRWAPRSKLVFVAPTKPLVNQQIDACYRVCGIPARDIAEMTGGVDINRRRAAYAERRVFFLTPQTLENDLRKGLIEAKDISCMVVDEAHHATGKYAYVECVRLVYEQQSSFRILALTATPGKDVETVQTVVDALHISRIEIRSDTSIDIRAYVHGKDIETVLLDLPPELLEVQTHLANVMKPMAGKLVSKGVGMATDPTKLTRFTVKSACDRYRTIVDRSRGFSIASTEATLGNLAAAMQMLNEHGLRPFATLLEEGDDGTHRTKIPGTVRGDPDFKRMMAATRRLLEDPSYAGHPKLDYLSGILLNHFQAAGESGGGAKETRAMVFTSLRVSADAILKMLKPQSPLIRATPFFGQGKGKSADEVGMSQKEQKEVIGKFKSGTFNVIVATSVGEEGLDIGEVDLIICYDSSSSPARMLQRMGRTGRKREGQVYVLCLKGKEEMAFIKAKDAHRVMQKKIEQGIDLQLCEDVRRIIPHDVQPECRKRLLEAPSDDRPEDFVLKARRADTKQSKARATARKSVNMPKESVAGFVRAGSLVNCQITGPVTRKTRLQKMDERVWDFGVRGSQGLLSASEHAELERRYATGQEADGGDDNGDGGDGLDRTESVFRSTSELRKLTRTKLVPHSSRTREILQLTRDVWQPQSLKALQNKYLYSVEVGRSSSAGASLAQTQVEEPTSRATERTSQPSPLHGVKRGRHTAGKSALDNISETDDESDDDENDDMTKGGMRQRIHLSQLRREEEEDDRDDLPDVSTFKRPLARPQPTVAVGAYGRVTSEPTEQGTRPSADAGVRVRKRRVLTEDDDDH